MTTPVLYTCQPGERWVDLGTGNHGTAWPQAVKAAGYDGIIWDVYNATAADIQATLAAGLGVRLFQGYDAAAWRDPRAAVARARQAVSRAHALGYVPGAQIDLDFENCPLPSATMSPWINQWAAQVQRTHIAGLYIAQPMALSGPELYALLVTRYWRGSNAVPMVPIRGFETLQTAWDQTVGGIAVDVDVIQHDALGALPVGMKAPTPPVHPASPPAVGANPPATASVPTADLAALQATVATLVTQVAHLQKGDHA